MIKNIKLSEENTPLPNKGGGEACKQIAILGSTGSIGTQALQVIAEHADLFEARVLTANNRWELLVEQARQFQPAAVVIDGLSVTLRANCAESLVAKVTSPVRVRNASLSAKAYLPS